MRVKLQSLHGFYKWWSRNICFSTSLKRSGDRLCGLVVRVPGYKSRGPGFHSWGYQIFWEVDGLEQGPLSLVRITEELLEWKSSGSGLENRINGPGDPLRWPRDTLYPQKLALTSPTSGGRSVSGLKITEFLLLKRSGNISMDSGSMMTGGKAGDTSGTLTTPPDLLQAS
jgi:hypothetical protein